jgi:CIC family chloride channel protein
VSADTLVSAFREAFPLGSANQVVAVEEEGRYAGLVIVSEAHAQELPASSSIRSILRHANDLLLPFMTIKEAVHAFDRAEAEELAVVDSRATRRVVGLLTEAHALRRYAEALDLRQRDLLGEE